MAADMRHLVLEHGTYLVRVMIPADAQAALGKTRLTRSLGTGDPIQAAKMKGPIVAEFKALIAQARGQQAPDQGRIDEAQFRAFLLPIVDRMLRDLDTGPGIGGRMWRPSDFDKDRLSLAPSTAGRIASLVRVMQDPANADDAIPGFDEYLLDLMTEAGIGEFPDPAYLPAIKRAAALIQGSQIEAVERRRIADAHKAKAESMLTAGGPSILSAPIQEPEAKSLPPASIPLSELYRKWIEHIQPAPKERGRLDHQFRRLREFFGDVPANYVEKAQVVEFMRLVARFPGRKRSAALGTLPIRKLVERFESENAKREDAEKAPTLTRTTVEEWFAGFKRMYEYAIEIEEDHITKNPFGIKRELVITGAAPVERRQFEDQEIKVIFSQPLFQGCSNPSEPYRDQPGSVVVRDAYYWLPILSLFHGGRLAEFAAMSLDHVKATEKGTWFFDLTARPTKGAGRIKTATSQRQIPLHPKMKELGFVEYVEALKANGETWLFPDLDHVSPHGPGHAFSKWWGRYTDKIGLTDPAITHHSWRHTWKRAARVSPVKEELHDIMSGHKGANTVSRRYGEGAPIEVLAKEMARIKFPMFPALPVSESETA